jgi:chemosensory pili system protein ChpE
MSKAPFWTAFVLGIIFCAPPGSVTVETLRRGIQRGFTGAVLVQLGSLVGDATWAALALSGVAYLAMYRMATVGLELAGVFLLFFLAIGAWKDAWAGTLPKPRNVSARSDFMTGVFLSLSNPFTLAFWLGLGGTAVVLAQDRHSPPSLAVFFAGFMFAACLWCFFTAAIVAWGRQFLVPPVFRWVNLVCGAALAYFGVRLLMPLLHSLAVFGGR